MEKSTKKPKSISLLVILTIICLVWTCNAQTQTELAAGFIAPPDSAKPLTWWHWMNGNVTKEGITADLEKMKEIGEGGFQIFDVGQGIPQGQVTYHSPEWLELMKWAATEADRLGLEYDIHNCPGWSSTGGPWVTPEYAMKSLVWTETIVTGNGSRINVALVQPRANLDYYKDVFVLAYPAPSTEARPIRATSNSGSVELRRLTGSDPSNGIEIQPVDSNDPEKPSYLILEYAEPVEMRQVILSSVSLAQPAAAGARSGRGAGAGNQMRLEASDDGVTFRTVSTIAVAGGRGRGGFGRRGGSTAGSSTTSFPAVKAKYFRLVIPQAMRITEFRLSNAAIISDWQRKSNSSGGRGSGTAPVEAEPVVQGIDPESVIDISKYMNQNGRLNWQAPAGNWVVIRFGYTATGTINRAASETGSGLEIDKYSREAVDFHWKTLIEPLLPSIAPIAKKGLAGVVVDSYEAGMQNWTPKFPEEFQRRCGYDLKKYMPAMTGKIVGNSDISDRFLWDMRRTMADMIADNYYGYIAELCHKNGLKFYTEPYDTAMFDEFQVGATADVIMGEFWQGRGTHRSIKLVSSIAHVNGIKTVGAESFTSRSQWTEYPYSLKPLGDLMYTLGLNRYIFHRHAMQPHLDAVPGMTMGPWGGHFDRTNTWWNQNAAAWLLYVARCQYILQQGRFVGDLLYYEGENAPLRADSDRNSLGVPQGFDFDITGKDAILNLLSVKNSLIVLPDGMNYHLLVLPNETTMTVEVARKLRDLVSEGMWLVGQKPIHTPRLVNYPAADKELQQIANEVWGNLNGTTVTSRTFGKGQVFWGQPIQALLDKLNLEPDFEFTSRSGNAVINYIHRRTRDTDIYFIANNGYKSVDLVCTFRVEGKQPEFWKADTGKMIPASIYNNVDGRTRMPLQLDPAGSVFVVFRSQAPANHTVSVAREGTMLVDMELYPVAQSTAAPVRRGRGAGSGIGEGNSGQGIPATLEELPVLSLASTSNGNAGLLFWQNGTYSLQDNAGRTTSVLISGIGQEVEIAGPWHLSFPPKLGAPSEVTLDKLISWTEHSDTGVKYFSGTATYSKQVNIAADRLTNSKRLYLDLGRVMVLAEVLINSKNLGVLWKAPYRIDITEAVHAGNNDLEIRITNLWPNRLIGDEQLPDNYQYSGRGGRGGGSGDGMGGINATPEWYVTNQPQPENNGRVTFTMYKYYGKDSPLLESGLIGPVKLITAVQRKIK